MMCKSEGGVMGVAHADNRHAVPKQRGYHEKDAACDITSQDFNSLSLLTMSYDTEQSTHANGCAHKCSNMSEKNIQTQI